MRKKNFRRILIVILSAVFLFSVGMQIRQKMFYQEGEKTYDKAKELAGITITKLTKNHEMEMKETEESPKTQTEDEEYTEAGGRGSISVTESVQTDPSEIEEQPAGETEASTEPIENPEANSDEESKEEKQKYPGHIHSEDTLEVNLESLKDVNNDVTGWILIPDTQISYPLVQGEDNDYYLKNTWDKERNNVGAVFMDYRNNPELEDFNTLIYGHRMRDNSMFGILKYYVEQEFWEKHPRIYLADEGGTHCYDIFAAYEVSTDGITYKLNFNDEEEKQNYIDECVEASVIETGVVPTVKDEILTLSTCTANGKPNRWIVQGVIRTE